MVRGAFSSEEHNRRENTYFIGAVARSRGLSAMDMVPRIAEDLKMLENGMAMHSAEYNEDLLVISPVVYITADSLRHSELCGLLGLTTLYSCRFCYYRKLSAKDCTKVDDEIAKNNDLLNYTYTERTKHHYCLAASTPDRKPLFKTYSKHR
ncbi:hypothetical protein BC941DRAFT_182146 [Chlamydoabsidia padenii]|nr:hypothetical protein BC941DRAFT_182146 [Chlamydoabsidia padenii]